MIEKKGRKKIENWHFHLVAIIFGQTKIAHNFKLLNPKKKKFRRPWQKAQDH